MNPMTGSRTRMNGVDVPALRETIEAMKADPSPGGTGSSREPRLRLAGSRYRETGGGLRVRSTGSVTGAPSARRSLTEPEPIVRTRRRR